MNHVMLDLETLGNSPGCVISSIGAVEFDPVTQTKGRSLYLIVNKQSCIDAGLKVNAETEEWWTKQAAEAQQVLRKAESEKIGEDNVKIESALIALRHFITSIDPNVKVWSCGSDFDLPILIVAFELCGIPVPWKFWNSRCHRTWKALAPWVRPPNSKVAHNALEDASDQVTHLFEIAKNLRIKIK